MKIRTDFVTNSSSSSFIACGVWSEELAEFVTQLLGGKNRQPRFGTAFPELAESIQRVFRYVVFKIPA